MDTDELQDPKPISLTRLAKIYGVSTPSLHACAKKLTLRHEFMQNPYAVRSWMEVDKCSRGKIRRIVFDESECIRIAKEVEQLRYPTNEPTPL